jgi:hypothetical protein
MSLYVFLRVCHRVYVTMCVLQCLCVTVRVNVRVCYCVSVSVCVCVTVCVPNLAMPKADSKKAARITAAPM